MKIDEDEDEEEKDEENGEEGGGVWLDTTPPYQNKIPRTTTTTEEWANYGGEFIMRGYTTFTTVPPHTNYLNHSLLEFFEDCKSLRIAIDNTDLWEGWVWFIDTGWYNANAPSSRHIVSPTFRTLFRPTGFGCRHRRINRR